MENSSKPLRGTTTNPEAEDKSGKMFDIINNSETEVPVFLRGFKDRAYKHYILPGFCFTYWTPCKDGEPDIIMHTDLACNPEVKETYINIGDFRQIGEVPNE